MIIEMAEMAVVLCFCKKPKKNRQLFQSISKSVYHLFPLANLQFI